MSKCCGPFPACSCLIYFARAASHLLSLPLPLSLFLSLCCCTALLARLWLWVGSKLLARWPSHVRVLPCKLMHSLMLCEQSAAISLALSSLSLSLVCVFSLACDAKLLASFSSKKILLIRVLIHTHTHTHTFKCMCTHTGRHIFAWGTHTHTHMRVCRWTYELFACPACALVCVCVCGRCSLCLCVFGTCLLAIT